MQNFLGDARVLNTSLNGMLIFSSPSRGLSAMTKNEALALKTKEKLIADKCNLTKLTTKSCVVR